jgi:hypothetical protein
MSMVVLYGHIVHPSANGNAVFEIPAGAVDEFLMGSSLLPR